MKEVVSTSRGTDAVTVETSRWYLHDSIGEADVLAMTSPVRFVQRHFKAFDFGTDVIIHYFGP